MSGEIMSQFRFLLSSLCIGMALLAGYDVLRLLRFWIFHGKVWIWVEDILYWCLVSFPVFYAFFRLNQGSIRWYGMTALTGGAFVYEFGFGRVFRAWGTKFFLPKKQKMKSVALRLKRGVERILKRVFCAGFTKNRKKKKKDCKARKNQLY